MTMSDVQNEKAGNGAPAPLDERARQRGGAIQASHPEPVVWRASPELDAYESADELLVVLNVPGATPQSVDVQVIGNQLHVRAEQSAAEPYADTARAVFERHLELPVDVDASSAAAELRDGVLQIRLQKSASARRVKIPVSAN